MRPRVTRGLVLSVYLPALIFATGQGTIVPLLPVAAVHLGASASVASAAAGAYGIGIVAFDLPAGRLVSWLGDRRAITASSLMLASGLLCASLSRSPTELAVSAFLVGCGQSTWLLSRLTYVSEVVPDHGRGKALSAVGGITRLGNFVGPFLAAGVVTIAGTDGAFYVGMACALLGGVTVAAVSDPRPSRGVDRGRVPLQAIVARHRQLFLTVGSGIMVISVLRSARQVVLPLWALHLGLGASAAGILYGISAAADMIFAYPGGVASDRWGRRAVAVPTLLLLSVGLFWVPFTSSFVALALVGIVMGVGNGLGSGIVMTIGSDFAPSIGRAKFLSVWRLISDTGTAGGPIAIGAVATVVSVGVASGGVSLLGLLGVFLFRSRRAAEVIRHRPPAEAHAPDIPAEAAIGDV